MGRLGVKFDYEELRKARISENQARLASIGLQKTISELRSITPKSQSLKRKYNKVDYFSAPLRRSNRLNGNSSELALRCSNRLNEKSCSSEPPAKWKLRLIYERDSGDDTEKRPANAPLLSVKDGLMPHLTPEAIARRCTSKDRGTIYDPILGICCHFCRQKKLCGEEDCKRCGDRDMDQPCLGKEDCSICHSTNGVLCRGCLKVHYGEETEEVRASKGWVCPQCTEEKCESPNATMVRPGVKIDYEELRKARILENQARLASIGLQKTISELRSITSRPQTKKRKYNKVDCFSTPLRRSNRLNSNYSELAVRPSSRLNEKSSSSEPLGKGKLGLFEEIDAEDDTEQRPANAPLLIVKDGLMPHLTPEAMARRCTSKDRGTVYDPLLGICCHFCRQKKLCGEEDCKRCGDRDMDQPCLGKTDCSICHSTNGVLCRGCLKVRYGEEMEEVRANKGWVCPHCTEEKGINPYWICNSSLCLKRRKMAPTGIAIYKARQMGFKSVAHLLMDQLQRADKGRR